MTKPSASKKPEENPEKTILLPAKLSSTSKKKQNNNEIDEIFSGKKKRPNQQKSNVQQEGDAQDVKAAGKPKLNKEKKKKKHSVDTDLPARSRRKTEDGFTVYTEEELGVNHADAGGTPLCPFDCDCCF